MHELASGAQLGKVELPGLGSVGGLTERPEGGHEAWFGYTDYATPGLVLRYDAVAGSARRCGSARPATSTSRQCWPSRSPFPSADGTTIRMVVVSAVPGSASVQQAEAATDAVPARARPAILYGYGGFNVSLTPAFSAAILAWVEAGGSLRHRRLARRQRGRRGVAPRGHAGAQAERVRRFPRGGARS